MKASSLGFVALTATLLSPFVTSAPSTETSHHPRYVSGLAAPSGYTYSWAINRHRLAFDTRGAPSYLGRSTVSKDASRTTQHQVDACVATCEKTVGCAMASVVKFDNFSEGSVICGLYSASLPVGDAKKTKGLFAGPGTVKASYAFTRNAGQVKGSASTTSSASAPTASSPSTGSSNEVTTYDSWVWIDVPGTTCADGTQTGFAVNLHAGSTDLVIGLQEGGSCYDYQTCYVNRRAYNMKAGFHNSSFWSQNQPNNLKWWFPFARDNQYNPWQTANYAWVPYCTGDFHSGDNVVQYSGSSVQTHHKGAVNTRLDMAKMKQLLPGLKRVWIAGTSAGAFGSILQYNTAQDVFGVRVDVLADSGETPKSILVHPSQNIQVPTKSRCPNCNNDNFDSYIVGLAQANPDSRFTSLSWSNDSIIPINQGVSFDAFQAEIQRLFADENQNTRNARNFLVKGSGHGLLYTTQYNAQDGTTMATFLNKFRTDDPYWASH